MQKNKKIKALNYDSKESLLQLTEPPSHPHSAAIPTAMSKIYPESV